jgi:pyochelin biosynthesis protein PchC
MIGGSNGPTRRAGTRSRATIALPGRGSSLRRFSQGRGEGRVLVCFPHAGGAASFFAPWARLLPSGIEMVAVQYPGRQDRRDEPLPTDIGALADQIAEELVALAGRPLALFGHSLGALVAFEVAGRLEQSREPDLIGLIVSGRRAPSSRGPQVAHRLDDETLLAEAVRLGGTPRSLLQDAETIDMILPPIRADYRMLAAYRWPPGPPLRCPISAYCGASDPRVVGDEIGEWRTHTTAAFEVRSFTGGHFYMNDRQVLGHLIASISRDLAAFAGTATPTGSSTDRPARRRSES